MPETPFSNLDSSDRTRTKPSRIEWWLGYNNPFRRVAELNLEIRRHGRSTWRHTKPSSRQRSSTLWGRCCLNSDSGCRHISNFKITCEGRCSCTIRMAFSWMPSWESIGKPTEGHYHSSTWNCECQLGYIMNLSQAFWVCLDLWPLALIERCCGGNESFRGVYSSQKLSFL